MRIRKNIYEKNFFDVARVLEAWGLFSERVAFVIGRVRELLAMDLW